MRSYCGTPCSGLANSILTTTFKHSTTTLSMSHQSEKEEETHLTTASEEAQPNVFSRIRSSLSSIATSNTPPSGSEIEQNATVGERGSNGGSRQTVSERFLSAMSLRPKGSEAEFPPAHWKADTASSGKDGGDASKFNPEKS